MTAPLTALRPRAVARRTSVVVRAQAPTPPKVCGWEREGVPKSVALQCESVTLPLAPRPLRRRASLRGLVTSFHTHTACARRQQQCAPPPPTTTRHWR